MKPKLTGSRKRYRSHKENGPIVHCCEGKARGTPLPLVYENNGVAGAGASKSLSYKHLEAKS